MSAPARSIVAVTFDYWDTLVPATPGPFAGVRRDAVLRVLADHGHAVAAERFDVAMGAVFTEEFEPAWHANRQYTAVDAGRSLARRLGEGAAPLGDTAAAAVVEAFATAGVTADVRPDLAPGIAATIAALADAGVRLGIVCDVGLTPSAALRGVLDRHGVLDAFDHWSFSDEVGAYKPDATIFRHALDGLGGVDPAEAAHVGDLRRTDIAGARAMGMTAIRYHGLTDDPSDGPEGHHTLAHHADLPALLTPAAPAA